MLQRYLYPIYKPTPGFKLVKLEDTCAPCPTLSLAGLLWNCRSASVMATLCCCCCCCYPALRLWLPLVYTRRQLLPALSGPLCSCLHALWSCPAWNNSGPPTPSGPVLPGSTLWSSPCPVASLRAGPAIFL